MVPEPSSGLRFDIYERVQLPEHVAGIKELEEIELAPNIHVERQAEQTVLQGNLRLSGRYVGDSEYGGSQVLEYFIPVEITLPAERSQILDELGAEIENFDIDVVAPRSLNVTGVLSLKGLDVSLPDRREWQEEEVVFIHEARQEPAEPEPVESAKFADLAEPAKSVGPAEPAVKERIEADKVKSEPNQLQVSSSEPAAEQHKIPEKAKAAEVPVEAENENAQVIGSDEKQEMKIAFGGKKIFETIQEKAYHLKNLLHRQSEIDQLSVDSQGARDEDLADAKTVDEKLEWKSLFLPKEDGEPFRKMRMCIVQKQESLETIAERYSLNPREIILFNRLDDSEVSEGQVIYIPK